MMIPARKDRENGRDYALRTIKENIIRLELAPGSKLSENELAAALGLSRTPVREALQELSKTKLIEVYPQRGSVVSLIDYKLVEEATFMRNVLECAVVELDCEIANPYQIAELEANVKLQEFSLENFSPEKLMELDNEFHRMLFEIADKRQSYLLLESMMVHFDRVRTLALRSVRDLKIVEDHWELVRAIAKKDSLAARQIMNSHLNRYKIDREDIRRQYPEYLAEN